MLEYKRSKLMKILNFSQKITSKFKILKMIGRKSCQNPWFATCGVKSDNDREHCQDPVIVAEQPRAESNRTHSTTLYSKTNRFVKR